MKPLSLVLSSLMLIASVAPAVAQSFDYGPEYYNPQYYQAQPYQPQAPQSYICYCTELRYDGTWSWQLLGRHSANRGAGGSLAQGTDYGSRGSARQACEVQKRQFIKAAICENI